MLSPLSRIPLRVCVVVGAYLVSGAVELDSAHAQTLSPYYYEIGDIDVIDLYVDPARGSDEANGLSRGTALRNVRTAWNRIPTAQILTRGYRINLLPGVFGDDVDELPNYWERKQGTKRAPIILRALEGQGSVTFTGDINMAFVSYFYLINISIVRGGDTFHCEGCDHILLRGNTLIGAPNGRSNGAAARETVKFNQSQYIFIESNFIRGAQDNAIDWVGVQYGQIVGNKVSDSGSWCAYVKGGSSYVRIEANEFYECFEGGVTAGQGTGFEFMTAPWLRYEAYDIKIINNIIHSIFGAALGVNGGYNVLLAHNTAYKVGARSHLIEVVFGLRSCDGDSQACAARAAAGGWGPSSTAQPAQPIGNAQIKVLNNILYNPTGHPRNDQHFAIYGPQNPTVGGIPAPQRSDVSLEIRGNVIWNGGSDHSLGVEGGEQGCQPSNTTCNETQLRAENSINTLEPQLRDPQNGDFRPLSGGSVFQYQPTALGSFPARGAEENTPEGELVNTFQRDFSGQVYSALRVGAFASHDTSTAPPANDSGDSSGGDVDTPQNPNAPRITKIGLKTRRIQGRLTLLVRISARDNGRIKSVKATLLDMRRVRLKRAGQEYVGSIVIRSRRGVGVFVVVTDNKGLSSSKTAQL